LIPPFDRVGLRPAMPRVTTAPANETHDAADATQRAINFFADGGFGVAISFMKGRPL
jgi:hypothetical protein